MSKGTITIKSDVSEQELMEGLLNQYHSGYFVQHIFLIYALGKRMHIDDFTYYWKMIGGGEND